MRGRGLPGWRQPGAWPSAGDAEAGELGIDPHVEAAVDHALAVEKHVFRLHVLGHARVVHDLVVGASRTSREG